MDCYAGHDMNEETVLMLAYWGIGGSTWVRAFQYLVTLSSEWNTKEFLHMAIATALLPKARQNVLMKRRLDCGNTQILSMRSRFTK